MHLTSRPPLGMRSPVSRAEAAALCGYEGVDTFPEGLPFSLLGGGGGDRWGFTDATCPPYRFFIAEPASAEQTNTPLCSGGGGDDWPPRLQLPVADYTEWCHVVSADPGTRWTKDGRLALDTPPDGARYVIPRCVNPGYGALP
eukprot:SAG11_NODE_5252_length_1615_cov_1.506596_1_plen_143_part_00